MTPYIAPCRQGVIALAIGRPFTAAQLAERAGVAEDRAKAYCSILVANSVLRLYRDEYRTAVAWARWVSRASRARPHRQASEDRATADAIREALCANLRQLREAAGFSQGGLAREAGVQKIWIHRAEKLHKMPPAVTVVLLARALEIPVEKLVERRA